MTLEMVITSVVSSLICLFFISYCGSIILGQKLKLKESIIFILLYTLFLVLNFYIEDRVLKTFSAWIVLIFFYKICFKKDWMQSIVGTIVLYFMVIPSEIIYGLVISSINNIFSINLLNTLNNTIAVNLAVCLLVISTTHLLRKKIRLLLDQLDKYSTDGIIVLFVILMLTFTMILNRINLGNWALNLDTFINVGIFILLFGIFILALKQKYEHKKFLNKYSQLANYSKLNDEVLEEYRLKSHEFQNQLAIIKTMTNSKNKELMEYLDTLIEKNKTIKYAWINQVKYIQIPGLKGLFNFKIMEFNSLGIKTNVIISRTLKEFPVDFMTIKDKDDLYSIIGVYLDNAKEASLESKEKIVSIDISVLDDKVRITISNTYKGKIEKEKLDNYRYSTKGRERGIGLYLVQKIINRNPLFEIERDITDKYFIQKVYIKTKKH